MKDLSGKFDKQNPNLASFFYEAQEHQDTPECLKSFNEAREMEFPYEIKELIDEGGMKKIYRAYELATQREVALAVISKGTISTKDLRYFINEIRITAGLQHPNIMPVYDAGLDPQGNPYFTMKLLNGENLARILNELSQNNPDYQQKFHSENLLEIFKSICYAVSYAHSKSIVHLDLKPENILINDFGEVLVLDWGIAKLMNRLEEQDNSCGEVNLSGIEQTFFGAVRGTPGYMAPEQKKTSSDVDERTDIFGLGAILYSLITYDRPTENLTFASHTPLNYVIQRATQENANLRYQSVKDLIEEIDKHQSGHATAAEDAGFYRLLTLLINRNKRLFAALLFFLIVTIAITYFFISELQMSEQLAKQNEQKALTMLDKWQEEKVAREKQEKSSAKHHLSNAKRQFMLLNFKQADEEILKARALSPDNEEIKNTLADYLFTRQKFNAILKTFPKGLQNKKLYKLAKRFAKLKSDDEKFNHIQNLMLIKEIVSMGKHVYTHFMTALFIHINEEKSFSDEAKKVTELFALLNPGVTLSFDKKKDRIKISGQPVFSYTPIAGLRFKELDLSETHFSESVALGSLKHLEYLDLSGTGVIHISGVYKLPKLKYLNLERTPIRSLLHREHSSKMDYFSIAHTTLPHFKGDSWNVKTLDIRHTANLDWNTLLYSTHKIETIIVNKSLYEKNIEMALKLKEAGTKLKVVEDER